MASVPGVVPRACAGILLFCWMTSWLSCTPEPKAPRPVSAVFGHVYGGGMPAMEVLKSSGFDTFVIWAIHVHADGTVFLNDDRIITGGRYVGRPEWAGELASLREGRSSIRRIEVSVGGWGVGDFREIPRLLAQGDGPGSPLYENFAVLKQITGAEAVNFNDEDFYDVEGTVAFGRMLARLGYRVTLCPFTREDFWVAVERRLGAVVDRVYLICYDGGRFNQPAPWARALRHPSVAGLKSADLTPGKMEARLRGWNDRRTLGGGFVWFLDDMMAVSPGLPKAYAGAVNRALDLEERKVSGEPAGGAPTAP